MKRPMPLRAITLLLVTALIGAAPAWIEAAGLAVELDVAPSTEAAGLYEVTAQIRDAESDEMLSVPTVVFPKGGEPAKVTSSTPTGGTLELTISISPDESTVTYSVERRENGDVVASQEATIRWAARSQ